MTPRRLPSLALAVAAGVLAACAAGREGDPWGLGPPGRAVPVEPGRVCEYAGRPGELPPVGRIVPASLRTGLDLWGRAGDPSDTLEVSIRYGPAGALEWVRVIGAGAEEARMAELERLLTRAVPAEGRPDGGVRLVLAGDGRPLEVLPAVVCEPQQLSRLATPAPVGTPAEVVEMRRARGRRAEVRVLLDDRGRIVDAEVVGTSGSRLVDAYALAAARNTSFRPGLHDGFPVAGFTTLRFELDRH